MIKVPPNNAVQHEYAFLARRYDFLWKSYIQKSIGKTLARVDLEDTVSLLDVGCGTGQLIESVGRIAPSVSCTGLDLTLEMLEIADDRLGWRIPLCCGNIAALPFASSTFDVITSSSVFHYVRTPNVALAEMLRVLRPGGTLILTDWCADHFGYRFLDRLFGLFDPAHFHIYGEGEIRSLLEEAGFEIQTGTTFKAGWFWHLMTVSANKIL